MRRCFFSIKAGLFGFARLLKAGSYQESRQDVSKASESDLYDSDDESLTLHIQLLISLYFSCIISGMIQVMLNSLMQLQLELM